MTPTPPPTDDKLLPCPFCGPQLDGELGTIHEDDGKHWFVQCYVCNVETAREDTRSEAIAAWNTRAALTPKPLSVAPEDEAHFKALAQCVHDCGDGDTDSQAVREYGYIAIDALRRRFAELRAVQDAGDAMNKALLAWLDENMDAKPDTPESVTLKRLSDIIEPYESVRWPIGGKK